MYMLHTVLELFYSGTMQACNSVPLELPLQMANKKKNSWLAPRSMIYSTNVILNNSGCTSSVGLKRCCRKAPSCSGICFGETQSPASRSILRHQLVRWCLLLTTLSAPIRNYRAAPGAKRLYDWVHVRVQEWLVLEARDAAQVWKDLRPLLLPWRADLKNCCPTAVQELKAQAGPWG